MLTFREADQSSRRIEEYIEMINDGVDFAPIIVIDGDIILDGHHRASAYIALNQEPHVISITSQQYEKLHGAGYDDIEIAAAAHYVYGDTSAVDALCSQFPGCNLYTRACDASELL